MTTDDKQTHDPTPALLSAARLSAIRERDKRFGDGEIEQAQDIAEDRADLLSHVDALAASTHAAPRDDDPQAGGRGLTMDEIRERYPEAYARAAERSAREASALPIEWTRDAVRVEAEPAPAYPGAPSDAELGRIADAAFGPIAEPAPTDADELARLLPGLAEDIERVRSMLGREVSMARRMRLARACELLLEERERLIAEGAGKIADRDCDIAMLRARVDELEALLSAPPVGSVAALLARVEEAHRKAQKEADSHVEPMRATYSDGQAHGLRSTLAAPSPLDRAVAEVCALPASDVIPSTVETIGDHAMVVREILHDISGPTVHKRMLFARAGRACLAGMLACDASGEKGGA